jgi:hypothetical protein
VENLQKCIQTAESPLFFYHIWIFLTEPHRDSVESKFSIPYALTHEPDHETDENKIQKSVTGIKALYEIRSPDANAQKT